MTTGIVATAEAEQGFYPTPPEVADLLLEGIEWEKGPVVLEPSAGTGNIVHAVLKEFYESRYRYCDAKINVDCVEIDPHLRSVLRYEFMGEKEQDLWKQKKALEDKKTYDRERNQYRELNYHDSALLKSVTEGIKVLQSGDVRIVHDNFLDFDTFKQYDVIVMNPPFADGDAHLLKAIQLQSRSGGIIRCILNAETIRNPFTNRRRLLQKQLLDMNAEVTFHQNAFSDGERKTDVEIAIVKIEIPAVKQESVIFDRLKKAYRIDEPTSDVHDMTVSDFMEQIVSLYKVECNAGIDLIREYSAMKPYILGSFENDRHYNYPTLTLCVGEPVRLSRGTVPSVNDYLKLVRSKYWQALFTNKEFIGRLTSNLREKYMGKIEQLANYDFTLFNIQSIAAEMNAEMGKGIEDTIVALFDKMTEQHSWYPETAKNVHYYNGWKTNKVHKLNSKVILPIYGVFATYAWTSETFRVAEAERTIADIEKVFDYLDGDMTAPVSLHGALQRACEEGRTRNIQCKYFDVTLYKKGTMHIRFHNQELVDRFNIYCCRKKNWLPPNYGNVAYSDMSQEEQTVVDGFHGDGTSGAGAKDYAKVLERKQYYLSEPVKEVQLLSSGA